jgi:chromosomal replication initiation ATPase DnaA
MSHTGEKMQDTLSKLRNLEAIDFYKGFREFTHEKNRWITKCFNCNCGTIILNSEKHLYKCHGGCGAAGDEIKFVQDLFKVSFTVAMQKIEEVHFKAQNSTEKMDEFLIGESNMFAYRYVQLAIDNFDNLAPISIIKSPAGLGKTYLLKHIQDSKKSYKSFYIEAYDFMKCVVKAVENLTLPFAVNGFRDDFDVLLIDDLDFFKNKTRTQMELVELIKLYKKVDKKIILTTSVAIEDIPGLSPGLLSLLSEGIQIDIKHLDSTLTERLYTKHLNLLGLTLDKKCISILVNSMPKTAREVIGIAFKLGAYIHLMEEEITESNIKTVLVGSLASSSSPFKQLEDQLPKLDKILGEISMEDANKLRENLVHLNHLKF